MLHKIFNKSSGSSLGVVRYILGLTKHDHDMQTVVWLGGSTMSRDPLTRDASGRIIDIDPHMLSGELDHQNSQHRNPDVRGVWHGMLSLPAGENLTDSQWKDAVSTYMRHMGYGDDTRWAAVLHGDTDYKHVHIVAARVYFDPDMRRGPRGPVVGGFAVVDDSDDHDKGMEVCRQIEKKYSLSSPPAPEETTGRDISMGERGTAIAAGRLPPKKIAAELACTALEACKKGSGRLVDFAKMCAAAGVGVAFNFDSKNDIYGVTYSYVDTRGTQYTWAGKQLKKARLTLPKLLQQEGLKYDKSTDLAELERISQKEMVRRASASPVVDFDTSPAKKPVESHVEDARVTARIRRVYRCTRRYDYGYISSAVRGKALYDAMRQKLTLECIQVTLDLLFGRSFEVVYDVKHSPDRSYDWRAAIDSAVAKARELAVDAERDGIERLALHDLRAEGHTDDYCVGQLSTNSHRASDLDYIDQTISAVLGPQATRNLTPIDTLVLPRAKKSNNCDYFVDTNNNIRFNIGKDEENAID